MNLGTQRLAEYHPPPTQHVRHLDPNGFYYPSLESSYQYPRYDWQAPQYHQQAPWYDQQAPWYDQQAPWYEQHAPRYDKHVPFASVSTGGSADISAGSLTERVVNNVCVPRLCIRTLADTATSADIYSPTRHVWNLDFQYLLEPKIRENIENLAPDRLFGHAGPRNAHILFSPHCRPQGQATHPMPQQLWPNIRAGVRRYQAPKP